MANGEWKVCLFTIYDSLCAIRHSRETLLLQRVEQLFEAARAGRADAALGRAERGGYLGVGRGLGGVEEHPEERAAAVAELAERGADEVLLFEPRQRLVGERGGVGEVVHLAARLALLRLE